MAKTTGLGDNFYVAGYNISGDTQSLGAISSGHEPLDSTAIDKSAIERLMGLAEGRMEFTTFWNTATDQEFDALSTLPRTDVQLMYFRGTTLGNPAAALQAKQVDYNTVRGTDGSLTHSVQALSSAGFPLEWGEMLTAGVRTDTTDTNGTSIDFGAASTAFGWQAYLQVFSVTGTDLDVVIEDSANNSDFLTLSGAEFTTVAAGSTASERLVSASATATVRRYVRVATTGTFNPASFAVVFVRNLAARTHS